MRLTWLYNNPENHNYNLVPKGQTINEVQVTREAVSDVIVKVITNEKDYINKSLAVVEPKTTYKKTSFY